ncbi:zf-HC2 domain-containing protein [bacterium]|nr:zf-HC2 domain-containing protein [bacterium]
MYEGKGPTTACALAASQLVALLDGEIPAQERGWVESHLEGCPPCREEHSALARVQGLVGRSLLPSEPETSSLERVMARIEAGEVDPLGLAEPARPERPSPRPGPPAGTGRRTAVPWALGAGSVALLAVLLAVAVLPVGPGVLGWLDAPSTPRGTATAPALTLTGRPPVRETRPARASRAGRDASVAHRAPLVAADPSRDLQVPEELRRRPGLFLDMGVVRRLDKLRKMEAVYRAPGATGAAG